jgi:hypothetical protein
MKVEVERLIYVYLQVTPVVSQRGKTAKPPGHVFGNEM